MPFFAYMVYVADAGHGKGGKQPSRAKELFQIAFISLTWVSCAIKLYQKDIEWCCMKLSTRSRYGTRMVLDLAKRYDEGPVRIGDIAAREGISVKYLEQLIIPLKQANFIKSVRGPKGGHMLTRPPERITVGEVVKVLEGGTMLTECVENPEKCEKHQNCMTRNIWKAASRAMYEKLDSMTLSGMLLEERQG